MSYCPHCSGALDVQVASGPARCPNCRLVVGVNRSTPQPTKGRSGGTSASGLMLNQARREDADPVEVDVVVRAILEIASKSGRSLDRLRMVDYDEAIAAGADGPSVAEVLATCGTWKDARDGAQAVLTASRS